MRRTRLIPVLLIHQGGIYKTSKFKNAVYIGDPINTIRLLNDMEVDEIVVLDIDASKENREPNYEMFEDLATEAFMPVGYGGGLRTVHQAKRILNSGAEKVIINRAAQSDAGIIAECASRFGSQSVMASIDYAKKLFGGRKQYDHVTGKMLLQSPLEAALTAEKMGAGEVLLNCVDRDGSMQGLDLEVIQEASQRLKIPLVVCGGAGNLEHLHQAEISGASAIAAGSMFVFHGKQRGILINYPSEAQLCQYLR
jgi:cyclase